MATTTIAKRVGINEPICQGDVFRNVKYSYLESEEDEIVNIIEYEFPYAIIVSQACDVTYMSELQSSSAGKATKFMPSILMCPIYDISMLQEVNHLPDFITQNMYRITKEKFFPRKEVDFAKNDMHYRFHILNVKIGEELIMEEAVIDNKHFFTVSPKYLEQARSNRAFSLDCLFAEQVSLKFASYLARVAIP